MATNDATTMTNNNEHDSQRWWEFNYYQNGGTHGFSQATIAPGRLFKIYEYRVHISTSMTSVVDLIVRVSSAKGSDFNMLLLSYAMSGVNTLLVQMSVPILLQSDDHVVINMSYKSAAFHYGIEVNGWAVRG